MAFVKRISHKGINYDINQVDDHFIIVNTQRPNDPLKARKGVEFEMGHDFVSISEAERFITSQ